MTHPAPPVRYTIPTIKGDPAAAFNLAAAYRDLADAVAASHRQVALIIGHLSGAWRGQAHHAIHAPVKAFLQHSVTLTRALREVASELDAYGQQLAQAQRHHGWSLGKIVKVGAVVAVSATAIVVTVGAAGVVEAAASAAVGGATAAAGTATAADVAVASGMDVLLESLSSLRPLLAFVVPHLIAVEWNVGAMAAYDEATSGRLQWRSMAEVGAVAFVTDSVAAKGKAAVGESRWLPHLVEGAAWGSAAGADDELTEHRLNLTDIAESFVLAGGSTAGRDALRARGWWPAETDYRRNALIALLHRSGHVSDAEIAHELALLRQPVLELERGQIDLRMHEGPGHTINRHVGKSSTELLHRVRTTRIPVASTYWDETGARDAIETTLRSHQPVIKRWVDAGCPKTLRLRMTSSQDLGFAIDRRGKVMFVRQAMVVLRKDSAGVVLVTSYPVR